MAAFSPDGRMVAFVDATSGLPQVRVQSIEGGGDCRVLTKGERPIWSADGRRLYFARRQSRTTAEVWSIAADGSNERKIVDVGPFRALDVSFDVTPRGQILWSEFNPGRHELWQAGVR